MHTVFLYFSLWSNIPFLLPSLYYTHTQRNLKKRSRTAFHFLRLSFLFFILSLSFFLLLPTLSWLSRFLSAVEPFPMDYAETQHCLFNIHISTFFHEDLQTAEPSAGVAG